MNFTIVDDELAILDGEEIVYVFERDSLSRAAYQYMIQWIQDKKSPENDPGTVWLEAEKTWDTLSPEIQATLIAIANKERQQAKDIRDGLLATLHEYQGVKRIKEAYADYISTCFSQLIYFNLTLLDGSRLGWNFVNFNVADTFLPHGEYTVPEILHHGKILCKPFTVTRNLDDDKFLGRTLFVLDEITHLEVHNLQQKLNLREVIARNFGLNLATQWTFDLEETSRFGDAVGTSTKKFVDRMLHETNLV